MTPQAQAIFDQANEVNRLAVEEYQRGYRDGWAAAMRSVQKERELNAKASGELLEACRK